MNIIQGVTLTDEQIKRSQNAWEQVFGNTTGTINTNIPTNTTNPVNSSNTTVSNNNTVISTQPSSTAAIDYIQSLIAKGDIITNEKYQKQNNKANIDEYDANNNSKDANNLPLCK